MDRRYYPMLFMGAGEADAIAALRRVWTAYQMLPADKKHILLSDEMPEKIKALQDTFRLNNEVIGNVTILIRKIFFGELSMAEAEAKIGSMLATTGGGDPNQARAIVQFIEQEILTLKPKPKAEETSTEEAQVAAVTANLPLLQALSQYERLGNQLITEARIKVKSQPEPVRPSLFYWLKYYRDSIGVGHHDSIQRGQFLFRSENGQKLSPEERERLSLILKSVEENFPLTIDTERQEIIFPAFQGITIGNRKEPAAIPANARIIRGPALSDLSDPGGAAQDERRLEKTFTPDRSDASRPPALDPYASRGPARTVLPDAPGGLRMGRGTHFGNLQTTPSDALAPGRLTFSTSHTLPAEKAAAAPTPPSSHSAPVLPQPPSVPVSRPKAVPPAHQPNPFHIHPVSLGKEEKQ